MDSEIGNLTKEPGATGRTKFAPFSALCGTKPEDERKQCAAVRTAFLKISVPEHAPKICGEPGANWSCPTACSGRVVANVTFVVSPPVTALFVIPVTSREGAEELEQPKKLARKGRAQKVRTMRTYGRRVDASWRAFIVLVLLPRSQD